MLRPAGALAAVLLTVLLLPGCVPNEPVITPAPEPSATPVFASDEEALAAATEAYAKYLKVADSVFANGGLDAHRMAKVAVGHQLEVETDGFSQAQEENLHSVGSTHFDNVSLQRYDAGSLTQTVVVYLCEDISDVDVLNEAGKSVVSPELPKRSLYEVTFQLLNDSSSLAVANKQLWSDSTC